VLDALRARKERFVFDSVDVALKPSVMAFITMNPGYPGRAELPESLKARRRPACRAPAPAHAARSRGAPAARRRCSGPAACACRT
jgi:hypothetical protein